MWLNVASDHMWATIPGAAVHVGRLRCMRHSQQAVHVALGPVAVASTPETLGQQASMFMQGAVRCAWCCAVFVLLLAHSAMSRGATCCASTQAHGWCVQPVLAHLAMVCLTAVLVIMCLCVCWYVCVCLVVSITQGMSACS